jgi:hypothetical protein
MGLLFGGFSGLAADDAFADTFTEMDDAETIVVVHHPADPDSLVEVLRTTNPSSLRT